MREILINRIHQNIIETRNYPVSKDNTIYIISLAKTNDNFIIIYCLNYTIKISIESLIILISPIVPLRTIDEAFKLISGLFQSNKVEIKQITVGHQMILTFKFYDVFKNKDHIIDLNLQFNNLNIIYKKKNNKYIFICKIMPVFILFFSFIIYFIKSSYEEYKKIFEDNDIDLLKNLEKDFNIDQKNLEKLLTYNISKNGIPLLGAISTGKSTFLNGYFGIDFFEIGIGITKKFITIIRHNPNLKVPIFYHVNLSENENGKYKYKKDGQIFKGQEEIGEKMKEINKKVEKDLITDYKSLFWMLELNVSTIENNKLLKEYEFYDIPGLAEISVNKKDENKKIELISGNYIKYNINFGIFILSAEEDCKTKSFLIMMEKIKEVLKSLSLERFAFIFNKINLIPKEKRKEKIFECKSEFLEFFNRDDFSILNVEFIPVDLRQIYHWNLIKKNIDIYENSLRYILNSFIFENENFDNSVKNLFLGKEKLSISNDNEITIKNDLYDYFLTKEMYKKIKKDSKNPNSITLDMYKLSLGVKDDILKKTENVLNDYSEELKNNDLDFYGDEESKVIIKTFYKLSKRKKLFFDTDQNLKLINQYFETQINYIENKTNKDNLNNTDNEKDSFKKYEILKNFSKWILDFKQEYPTIEIIKNLSSDILAIQKYINNVKKIFIPIIGISGVGKSTILNDIIGEKILPEKIGECTKRGIILQYNNNKNAELYEVEPVLHHITGNEYFIFETKQKILANGKVQVNTFLKTFNKNYTQTENKAFYLIKIHIQLFDELELDDSLKNKILFIDLLETNMETKDLFSNLYEYQKLLETSYGYIFIFKDQTIKSSENEDNLKMLTITKEKSKKEMGEILNNSLFIANMFLNKRSLKSQIDMKNITEEKEKMRQDLSQILEIDESKYSELINVEFFDALSYFQYLENKEFFGQEVNTIKKLAKDYRDQWCIFKSIFNNNCENYIKEEISKKMKQIFKDKKGIANYKVNTEKIKLIEMTINEECRLSKKNKIYSEEIAKYFEYGNKEINNTSLFIESRNKEFFKAIKNLIISSNSSMEKEFSLKIKKFFKKMNKLFLDKEEEKKNFYDKFKNAYDTLKDELKLKRWEGIINGLIRKGKECFDSKKKEDVSELNEYYLIKEIKRKVDDCISKMEYGKLKNTIKNIYSLAEKFYKNLEMTNYFKDTISYKEEVKISGGFWKTLINLFRSQKAINKEELENNLNTIQEKIEKDLFYTKYKINYRMDKLDKEISFDNSQVQEILKIEKSKISKESWEKLVKRYREVEKELIRIKILDS